MGQADPTQERHPIAHVHGGKPEDHSVELRQVAQIRELEAENKWLREKVRVYHRALSEGYGVELPHPALEPLRTA